MPIYICIRVHIYIDILYVYVGMLGWKVQRMSPSFLALNAFGRTPGTARAARTSVLRA